MRRLFKGFSWGHCVYLLIIAVTIVAVPELNPVRFVLAGVLVALAAVGIYVKLTANGSHKAEQDDHLG